MARQQFIPLSDAKNTREAYKICWWAMVIAKVADGRIAFENYEDYKSWRKEKCQKQSQP